MNKSIGDSRSIVAVLTGALPLPLAPENISTIPLYQIHLNLWGTLLSASGEPALARLIDTLDGGRVYQFELESGVRFSNGRVITSDDVIFSLNRLMHEQPNGHCNAKSVVKSVDRISENRFSIHLNEPTPSFLFLLSTPEMGIVPKEATDAQGKAVDLNITSGAYTVLGKPESDRIVLVKNSYFKKHESQSPDQVTILFRRGVEALIKAIDQDHADFLEFYESGGAQAFQSLKNRADLSYQITRPSYSLFASVNSVRVPLQQRWALSRLFFERRAQFIKLNQDLEKFSKEILPPGSFANLGTEDSPNSVADLKYLPQKLRVAVHDKNAPMATDIVKLLTEARIEIELLEFATLGGKTDYDVALLGQGMNADFPEIEFYLSILSPWAFISASDQDRELILRALHSSDRKTRSELLQQVGSALIESGRIIPLVVRSYAHVFKKDRLIADKFTTYDGDIPFWRMQLK